MTRKHTARILALLLLTASTAQAEAPASQFGFRGWPYRQRPACQETQPAETASPLPSAAPTVIPTSRPSGGENEDENGTIPPVSATQEPMTPTEPPLSAPTASPAPTATAEPTLRPTAAPTEKPAATQAPSMDEDYNTNSVSAQEQIAMKLLNNDRIANGLPALTMDPVLSELARIKSNDMRDNRYFAHESPTYGNASAMLKTFGYAFNAVGENIAHHANVEKAQAAFMSSDGHRRNILSSSWTKVGIGVSVDAQGYVYVTQLFVR